MTGIKAGLAAAFLPGVITVVAEAVSPLSSASILVLIIGSLISSGVFVVVGAMGYFLSRTFKRWDVFMSEQTKHNKTIEECITKIQVDHEGQRVKVDSLWEDSE